MSLADDNDFVRLRDTFLGEYRRIEQYRWRQNLRKSQRSVDELRADTVRAFNDLIAYLASIHDDGDLNEKLQCANVIQPFVNNIKEAFEILNLQYNRTENPFEIVDIALIVAIEDRYLGEVDAAQNDGNNLLAPALNIDPNNLQNQGNQENQEIMAQIVADF